MFVHKLGSANMSETPQLASSPSSNAHNSPPPTRGSSPSPSISPTPALYPCPALGRSCSSSEYSSTSASTLSYPSATSRSTSASAAQRGRGYVRPQGVSFAPSAGNRDSVLSLGSIAHLQYYFARTGLLEGKGGQLAKDDRGKPGMRIPSESSSKGSGRPEFNSAVDCGDDCFSDATYSNPDVEEPVMLPPTVSTYSHKDPYIEPPPDPKALRSDLYQALKDAEKALIQVSDEHNKARSETDGASSQTDDKASPPFSHSSAWYEIQGMNVLDMVTLAIRAAKIYYTSHEDPQCLYSIKSERRIREELLGVLDILKRMASRNFAGGMRSDETDSLLAWVKGVDIVLAEEQALVRQKATEREGWLWLEGNWEGSERERELLFLNSFNPDESLPTWTPIDIQSPTPTPFLSRLQTGLTLILLHNALLKRSKRTFGEIKMFHTDTAKPYRCAENLRYWMKAADLRWETKLKLDVSAVVHGRDGAWIDFDKAVLQWSEAVRSELTREWRAAADHFPEIATLQAVPADHDKPEAGQTIGSLSKADVQLETNLLKPNGAKPMISSYSDDAKILNKTSARASYHVSPPAFSVQSEPVQLSDALSVPDMTTSTDRMDPTRTHDSTSPVISPTDAGEYDPFRVDTFGTKVTVLGRNLDYEQMKTSSR